MTTNLVSIFSFNLLPEDPTAKEKRKVDSINHDQIKRVAALMVAAGSTVMAASMAVLYFLLTFTKYNPNPNIILNKDQLDHLILSILAPLYVVTLLGSAAFYKNYNQIKISCSLIFCCCDLSAKVIQILTTLSVLLLTVSSLMTGFFLMPAGPTLVHMVVKPTNGHHGLVVSAFAQNQLESEKCFINQTLDEVKCGEEFIDIFKTGGTSIKKITEQGSGLYNANLFVSRDLKNQCLECGDRQDNFCHRTVHEAKKHQRRVVWSHWTSWSKCSSVCGASVRSRTRTYEITSNEGILCLGPRKETEKCGKPSCKSYTFIEDKPLQTGIQSFGTFDERSNLFEGRPSFKQKDTKLQDGVFLFSDAASGEWRVSPGRAGRISSMTKPVMRSLSNTDYPPSEGWQYSCKTCNASQLNQWENIAVKLTEGAIKPCQEVQVTLFGATKENVYELWGKKASGLYRHYDDWVRGRPVYYKPEAYNFTLSFLPLQHGSAKGLVERFHPGWGFSDKADATYTYVVSKGSNAHSPGDVDSWVYYAGHDWEENELKKWPDANMTVVCKK